MVQDTRTAPASDPRSTDTAAARFAAAGLFVIRTAFRRDCTVRDRTVPSYVYVLLNIYTWVTVMRTNIDIDDDLIEAAMRATGQTTKRGTVEEALRRVVTSYRRRQAIADMAGAGLATWRLSHRATGVIVVDTSVWISHPRGHRLPAVRRLRDPAIAERSWSATLC